MSKFVKNLGLFIAGLPLLLPRSEAAPAASLRVTPSKDLGPVPLRPLNYDQDNLFAGHRSHSSHQSHASHSSHSSHYSGSSGYREPLPVAPPAPSPFIAPSPVPSPAPSSTTNSFSPASAPAAQNRPGLPPSATDRDRLPGASRLAPSGAVATPLSSAAASKPAFTLDEKRRLQIMRVQLALTNLTLYEGRIDGVLNAETRTGLEFFQSLKGLERTGTMTTETLNALGVPAVR